MRGWEQTLRDAGAEVPPVLPADWSAASGYRVGSMLARIPEVTAVFAANDHLALGILRALHEHGPPGAARTSASSASTTCPRRATSSRR